MNKNFKKTLSVILAVLMAVSCFSVVSFAATTYPGHEDHVIRTEKGKAATTCEDGLTDEVYCASHGDEKVVLVPATVIPAEHKPGEYTIVGKVDDCTKGYTMEKRCQLCKVVLDVKEVKEHDYQTDKIDQPYCDEVGTAYKTCSVCGDKVTQPVEVKLHSWGEDAEKGWETKILGNCTLDGVQVRECDNCLRVEERPIKATGHKYEVVDAGKEPSCTVEGSTAKKACANCGDVIPGKTIKAKGHKDADGDNRCDVCETYFTEQLPEGCNCPCHSTGVLKVLYEIVIFILSLFKVGANCACGAVHYTVD